MLKYAVIKETSGAARLFYGAGMQTIKIKNAADFEKFDFFRNLPFSECVTVLGFFDGVHIAHRELIAKAKSIAANKNIPLVIFTFSNEDNVKKNTKILFTDEEKLELFEELSADYTVIVNFSAISCLSGEEFVNGILVGKLHTNTAVCGYNFRFGYKAGSDSNDLLRFMKNANKDAAIMQEYSLDSDTVSSTAIRELLSNKELFKAAKFLGAPYSISGSVSHGLGVGKKLGIPTVNTEIDIERFPLPEGVYATVLAFDNSFYKALTNIGSCPTVCKRKTHAETFILDFDGNLYDKKIKIYFLEFLREEQHFSSTEKLILQINIDKNRALELTKEKKWQEIGLNLQ